MHTTIDLADGYVRIQLWDRGRMIGYDLLTPSQCRRIAAGGEDGLAVAIALQTALRGDHPPCMVPLVPIRAKIRELVAEWPQG